MQKVCSVCNDEKELKEFNFRNKKLGTRHSYCRECNRTVRKKNYDKNPTYYIKKSRISNPKYYVKIRFKIFEYLKQNPCVDCGEDDPIVLEFDHVRGEKIENVASLIKTNWEKVKTEIDKCEVRCSNCHKRKTAKQFNYYKYLVA